MKRYLCLIPLLSVMLFGSGLFADDDDDRFHYRNLDFRKVEVPIYRLGSYTPHVKLEMGYAQDEIGNPDSWLAITHKAVAYEIDLVFTLYPRDITKWRTDYYTLLNGRMQELFAMDSALNSPDIKWNMILQTEPSSEEEAKSHFHGFVIKYRPKRVRVVKDVRTPQELKSLIAGYATIQDSTVFHVMERHPEWDNMLVVMDWTGSMYKFGAQLVLWHKLHMVANHSAAKHFVFFNDGNKKKEWQKRVGRTGGVYRARNDEIDEIVSTMLYVMHKGDGGDPAENDLEAILTGIQYLENYGEIILIADNKSAIRDIELLDKIDKPVRIILCDVRGPLHPDYVNLAKASGGSIHTLEEDLTPQKDRE
ncbi:MAG: hypothetical protein AAFR59_05580 [Bacteroidota bacterium]